MLQTEPLFVANVHFCWIWFNIGILNYKPGLEPNSLCYLTFRLLEFAKLNLKVLELKPKFANGAASWPFQVCSLNFLLKH